MVGLWPSSCLTGVYSEVMQKDVFVSICLKKGQLIQLLACLQISFTTSIPTTVIILKKNPINRDGLFVDASQEFDKGKNQNTMTEAHIGKILKAYVDRKSVEKFAHLASFEEIKENDYNLNIPRYVDTFEEEEVVHLSVIAENIKSNRIEIEQATAELNCLFGDLVGTTLKEDEELRLFVSDFNA